MTKKKYDMQNVTGWCIDTATMSRRRVAFSMVYACYTTALLKVIIEL